MARKCKTCGGDCSEFGFGKYKCSWCGHEYSEQDFITENSNVSDLETFSLLNKARLAIELEYDFKKSLKYSQSVLEKNSENQEANWLALLAENQVIYIQNDKGKHVPTFLEPDKANLTRGKYYSALNERYKADAEAVEKVRLAAVEEFKKVKPYDVFISYKQHESDGTSAETKEAVWARDIYTELKTNPKTKHLNIFFDQKCLSGANAGWEPHIYSAIKSSKCMILLGSSLDNINSRWVKNEWKRFVAFKARGEKKDFIVLGSDNVNPLLLDEKLQEKQMITNTSGRWLNEIISRVSEICGKPKKEIPDEVAVTTPPKKKKKLGKKAIVAIVLSCVLALGGGGLGFGLWYKGVVAEVHSTQELISYLPDYEIKDYAPYEDLFDAALESYESLSNFKKGKVDNRNRLLNALEGFNTYRIEKLRSSISGISMETVSETDDLKNTVTLYGKLTSDQRAMLDSEEIYALEQYAKVYNVITSLNDIQDDVINRYGEVEGVKRTYLTIDPAYQGFVYNYSLVDGFAEQVDFYSSFVFTEVAGGYSIALAEGKTLSGEVELPSRYNGKNVVEIPEAAFVDCRGIISLTVPDTVLTIGKGAFQGCNNIVNITLPFTGKSETAGQTEKDGYEAVFGWIFGMEAQYDSGGLNGSSATGFLNIQTSPISGTICQYAYTDGGHYGHNLYYYYYYIPASLQAVVITKQSDIKFAAFNGCREIRTIIFNAEVNRLGDYAFQNCVLLERFNSDVIGTADLSGNIETVGDYAYYGCQNLTQIVIPSSIHMVGDHAFDGCRNIKELNLTDRITVIGDYAFQGMQFLTAVTVYNSTNSIGRGAFQGCNNIVDIILPFTGKNDTAVQTEKDGYEAVFGWIFGYRYEYNSSINGGASQGFYNKQVSSTDGTICQYVYIPSNEKYYHAEYLYYYYIPTTLRTVTITKQTDIPLAAFNGCSTLTQITYTNPIQSTGEYAFQNCVTPNQTSPLESRQYALLPTKRETI